MTIATPLLADPDSFLARAEERGAPLEARAAEAVLGLLVLCEARRRTGLPEPTEELAAELLHTLLPLYVSATESELPDYVAALVALADHTREAGRLNAKRHAKLVARVHELAEGFLQAMTSPRRLTWPRLYGNLLRADGVDTTDRQAVRDWLDAFAQRPHAERHAALGFAASCAQEPLAEAAWAEALCAERSRQARLLLAGRLEAVAVAERERPRPGEGPSVAAAPADLSDDELDDWYGEQAAVLADRWTAAGLDALLQGPFAHLAPGGEAPVPLLTLVEAMAGTHLEMNGGEFAPLPPAPLPVSAEDQAARLRATELPRLLERAAADPEGADERTRELALASGFLVRGQDGVLGPGPSAEAWSDGGPAELTGLALTMLGALLSRLAEEEGTAEEYDGEHVLTLYLLCGEAGTAQSVARLAALGDMWFVPPEHESAPPAPGGPETGDYELPDPQALTEILGIPTLTASDREGLQPAATRLVRLMDGLAALGVTERTGDALRLTPLGSALLREALVLGLEGPAADAFPTREQVRGWDAGRLVAAARYWPKPVARQTIGDWLAAHGAEGWAPLFEALAAPCPGPDPARRRSLLTTLDAAAVPEETLHRLLADPVLGGWAEHLLTARGQAPAAPAVPLSARAVRLLDELEAVRLAASLDHRMTAATDEPEPEPFPELLAAFDKAAAAWPGGGQALLTALAAADPYTTAALAQQLSHHPDRATAEQARRAWRTSLAGSAEYVGSRRTKQSNRRADRKRKRG
ncbi:hypothetical protein HYE82_09695 [Streptomyces sp. BR123]|uniref:hypothetical protein n=1 Tax=Streptomyces sp. BR123 TaxID=2749828 RepID=UPI0015C4880B|nr:hypothetical protein [Streptomyces sp. BR123]NXY94660.1 hypothetical protein [Streptomyces sp. BR123]